MADHIRKNTEEKLLQQSKRSLFHIVFSRTIIMLLMLLLNFFLLFSLLFELFEGITLVFGGIVAVTAVMMVIILNTDDDPAFKLSWCMIVAVLPLLGIVLYTIFRLDLGSRIHRRMVQSSIDASLAYMTDSPDAIQ